MPTRRSTITAVSSMEPESGLDGTGFPDRTRLMLSTTASLEKGILKHEPFQVLDQEGVGQLVKTAIEKGKSTRKNLKIGICGDAPSTYPEFAKFLVHCGIDSISLSPDAVIKTTLSILEAEKKSIS